MAITFGSEAVFQSAEADEIAVAMLDSTHAIIVYRDVAASSYGRAIIATLDGTSVTYGTEYTVTTDWCSTIHVAKIDATHAVICYNGASGYGYGVIATISNGNEIAFGTAVAYTSTACYINAVALLDSTHFVVAYQRDGTSLYTRCRVAEFSGTTISSYGTEVDANANASYKVSIDALDSTHFVVGYQSATGSWQGWARVGTVSGTTITLGTAVAVDASSIGSAEVLALDATHFLFAFVDEGSTNAGTAKIGVVSAGDTITFGDQYTFNTGSTAYIAVAKVDAYTAAIAYKDVGNSNYGTVILATISNGDDIAFGSETTFNSGITEFNGISYFGSDKAIIVYQDETNSSYGTGIVASLGLAPTLTATFDVDHIDLVWSSLA